MRKCLRSCDSATSSTSQLPLVSCFLSLPSAAAVQRCAYPVASETNQKRRPSSYHPPHPKHGPFTHALSDSVSTTRTLPLSALTVVMKRVLKSRLDANRSAALP